MATVAGFARTSVAGTGELRSGNHHLREADAQPGHPEPDASGCACRERPTEQSGEVWCRGGRTGRDLLPRGVEPLRGEPPVPVRPLTGFFPRVGFAPPTVIVSDLLSGGLDVDVMLLEVDEAPPVSRPRTPARDQEEAAPPSDQPRRSIFRPPVRVRFDPVRRLARPGKE